MNPSVFLDNFRLVSRAPNGLRQIRNTIRSLAIQGRLVPQQASDTPVTEFLNTVSAHKQQAETANRRQSRSTNLGQVVDGGVSLPKNWRWAFFGDVVVNRDGERVPLSKSIRTGHTQKYDYYGASGVIDQVDNFIFDKPLLLIGEDGANLLNRSTPIAFIATGKYWVNNHAHVLDGVTLDFLRYLELYINSISLEPYVTGTAQPKMNQAKMHSIPVAVPPLEEQQRIVAKVDELMRLCDRLESQLVERAKLLPLLSRANHSSFVTSASPAKLRSIFHQPGTVSPDDLRHTILSLAVQGKLIPQDPSDESVFKTLCHFVNPTDEIKTQAIEPLFNVPHGWSWFRVASLFTVAGGIQKTPHRSPKSNAWPYLGVSNVLRGRIDLSNVKSFELEPGELERRRLEVGDLLIIEGNGSFNEIGRCAKWNGEIDNCVHQNHVIRCRPCDRRLSDFVLLFLNSPNGIETMQRLAITSSGLYSLSVGKIRQIWIPIPPLAEQRRITIRVAQLMEIVDRLENARHKWMLTAESFAKAAVAAITSNEVKENKTMKPPKTEVVTALMVGKKPKKPDAAPLATLLSGQKVESSAKTLWQLSGLEIDTFYRQLKTEMANGWIEEDKDKRAVQEVEAR